MYRVFHRSSQEDLEGAEKNGEEGGSLRGVRVQKSCQVHLGSSVGAIPSQLCLITFLSLVVYQGFDMCDEMFVSYRIVFLP